MKQGKMPNKICLYRKKLMFHMAYVIEGSGALVNEKWEEQPLKAGDFALVNPNEKHQYRNKGDKPFKMICGVPKEYE
jgi:quercetin dioxygenase-like cupin family protein